MTDFLSRVRDIALLLPGAAEQRDGEQTIFAVEDRPFARVEGGDPAQLRLCGGSGWETTSLAADTDWTLIEDRVARSWELTAPRALLEAGGR